MIADYAPKIESLALPERIHFYELLAHNLTIVIRSVSNAEISDADKLERLKHINEIMHRVTAKVWGVRLGVWQYPDDVMVGIIEDYISHSPTIAEEVEWAVETSYQRVVEGE